MLNSFQKVLYHLSNPSIALTLIFFILAVQNNFDILFLLLTGISLFVLAGFILSFHFYKDKLVDFEINATDITKIDIDVFSYLLIVLAGISPIIKNSLPDINGMEFIFWIGNLIALIISNRIGKKSNIVLLINGYKFYQCKVPTGISGYILISKRDFRKSTELKLAKRLSEYVLLDGGKNV